MIGFLNGTVELYDGISTIVNVNGVGYKVFIANDVLTKVKIGEKTKLYIHTHVRDDTLDLYGFLDALDLRLFQHLIGVSGVGPKTALGIFSIGNREIIVGSILKGDISFFTTVPRLGKKNAQKIIIELKGKLGSTGELDLSNLDSQENNEAVNALKSLGFTGSEINNALKNIDSQVKTTEEKIKLALKYLSKV